MTDFAHPGGPGWPRGHDAPASPARSYPFTRDIIEQTIAERRARLIAFEDQMMAACEAHAIRAARQGRGLPASTEWDANAQRRYLAAAMHYQAVYGPPMHRIQREIEQLQRLAALPIVIRAANPCPPAQTVHCAPGNGANYVSPIFTENAR